MRKLLSFILLLIPTFFAMPVCAFAVDGLSLSDITLTYGSGYSDMRSPFYGMDDVDPDDIIYLTGRLENAGDEEIALEDCYIAACSASGDVLFTSYDLISPVSYGDNLILKKDDYIWIEAYFSPEEYAAMDEKIEEFRCVSMPEEDMDEDEEFIIIYDTYFGEEPCTYEIVDTIPCETRIKVMLNYYGSDNIPEREYVEYDEDGYYRPSARIEYYEPGEVIIPEGIERYILYYTAHAVMPDSLLGYEDKGCCVIVQYIFRDAERTFALLENVDDDLTFLRYCCDNGLKITALRPGFYPYHREFDSQPELYSGYPELASVDAYCYILRNVE